MKTTDENGPQFTGANKTIVKGTKVVWSNKDGEETHDVKSDVFYSGLLGPGKTFSYMFTEAGTYPYFCPLHFGMDGTITVTDG